MVGPVHLIDAESSFAVDVPAGWLSPSALTLVE